MLQPNGDHRIRRSLSHFILKANLYLSWVLGIFPFTFDSRKTRLHISKWLLAYGMILHLGLIIYFYMPETDAPDSDNEDSLGRNPLVEQLAIILDTVDTIGIPVTLLRTFWKSKEFVGVLNELLMLEHDHFGELILRNCPQFDWYVIFKGLTPLLVTISAQVNYFGWPGNTTTFKGAFWEPVSLMAIIMIVMQFHLAAIYIYRLLWIINGQLLDIVTRLRSGESVNSEQVKRLLFLYNRVLDLNTRLTKVFDIQITYYLLYLMSANIYLSHLLVISCLNMNDFFLKVLIPLMIQALIVDIWDIWMAISSCDLPERTGSKTSLILKLFNDIEDMDKELERTISEFTLFCCHHRLKIRQLGMFDINYERGFLLLITNILYVIFLVQFDYMNLQLK